MKHVAISDAMREALTAVAFAEARYAPGRDSASVVELPKLALADALLEALRAQDRPPVRRLPTRARAVPVVVDVALRPKRRRA